MDFTYEGPPSPSARITGSSIISSSHRLIVGVSQYHQYPSVDLKSTSNLFTGGAPLQKRLHALGKENNVSESLPSPTI